MKYLLKVFNLLRDYHNTKDLICKSVNSAEAHELQKFVEKEPTKTEETFEFLQEVRYDKDKLSRFGSVVRMICSVRSLGLAGMQGRLVYTECFLSSGLPAFEIVGLPDAAVKEARERVRAAVKSSGFKFPVSRITVNLAPAGVRKSGTLYDLPILLGILAASGLVRAPDPQEAFLGELSLQGHLRPVPGVLPMALAAKAAGIQTLYVPEENAAEATLARGPAVIPVAHVGQLVAHLNGESTIPAEPSWHPKESVGEGLDFRDVKGQENVKRALEIAAAGSHNVLLVGPPGSGKSMLSKRLPSILPDMTWEESLEVTQIYSILGLLTRENPMVQQRPFRSPHHTISTAGLAGGGTNPRPGEISMAHKGVLFLDEFPEFKKDTLDIMRQPLEDGGVTISRASGAVTYPAEFMLVCAMNPCKCGWYGDPSGRCTCSQAAVEAYQSRISGPLLDRIDLIVEVPAVQYEDLRRREPAESSASVRSRVNAARARQRQRFHESGTQCNARMTPAQTQLFCTLDQACSDLMRAAFQTMGLTARSYDRILRVARTIADLDESPEIQTSQLAEAIQYRTASFG